MNNINLTKLTTRTPHAIAAINYCLHHLYTWVSCATAALPTMSANCIPSELVVCRAVTRPLFFHTGVARARLGQKKTGVYWGVFYLEHARLKNSLLPLVFLGHVRLVFQCFTGDMEWKHTVWRLKHHELLPISTWDDTQCAVFGLPASSLQPFNGPHFLQGDGEI